MSEVRYVAIGDSFTEGVGDELADGQVRGWADLVAEGWARSLGHDISYANLAIRGKLVWPIVREQLEPALALGPTHLSFNGGGNDMLRPKTPISSVTDAFRRVAERCAEEGVRLILLSGGNPSAQLPLARLIQRRGDELTRAITALFPEPDGIDFALNWPDRELSDPSYWSADRLHMNERGHHRVAARVLESLGQSVPEGWWSLPERSGDQRLGRAAYFREHLGPWVKRRLTGTSSGDGREPKFADWVTVSGAAAG